MARTRIGGRRRTWGRIAALVVTGVLATACQHDNALLDIPSQMSGTPDAAYAEAIDSARAVTRRHIRAGYLPGVSVAVGRGGELVWAEAFGWADLSDDVPATPETLYPVGSVSKSLTATAAGLLRERGQLDLNAPIQTYLPDFPEKRWPVTTGELMGHIAGMRNYGMSVALRQDHCDTAADGVPAAAEDSLLFEPQTRYRYSNYGFRLVGAIVEAAAGEPYLDFMDRDVFTPLGMDATVPDLGDEGANEVTKYDRNSYRTLRRGQIVDMSCSIPEGGFLSTPSELVHFGFAMLYAQLLQPETMQLFWTPQRLRSGEPTQYGYGWQIQNVRLGDDASASTPMIGHGGSVLGGRAALMIFPEEDMVVVAMTNASDDIDALARAVAAHFRDQG